MANFFKGMLRANSTNYGDLEGPMTGIKKGKSKCLSALERANVSLGQSVRMTLNFPNLP